MILRNQETACILQIWHFISRFLLDVPASFFPVSRGTKRSAETFEARGVSQVERRQQLPALGLRLVLVGLDVRQQRAVRAQLLSTECGALDKPILGIKREKDCFRKDQQGKEQRKYGNIRVFFCHGPRSGGRIQFAC